MTSRQAPHVRSQFWIGQSLSMVGKGMYSCALHDLSCAVGTASDEHTTGTGEDMWVILMTQESVSCLSCMWSDIWEECSVSSGGISVLWRKPPCGQHPEGPNSPGHNGYRSSHSIHWFSYSTVHSVTQYTSCQVSKATIIIGCYHEHLVAWSHECCQFSKCFWTRMKFVRIWIIEAASLAHVSSRLKSAISKEAPPCGTVFELVE